MAWYCREDVRYRGRLVTVEFRYDGYQGARIEKGKPFKITPRDRRRILALLVRQGRARGYGDHGCGGPPPGW